MQIHSGFARWSSALAVLFALEVLLILWADEDVRETDAADTHAVPSDSASVEGTLGARNAALVETIEAAAARERSGGTLSEPSDRRDLGEEAMAAETGSQEEWGVEMFVEALENPDARAFYGTDPALQEPAANGPAQTGSERARDFLLEAAVGSDSERKSTAVSALAFDEDEFAQSVLAEALERGLIALEDLPDDALLENLAIPPEGAGCLNSDWVYPSCSRARIASADEAGEGSSGSGIPDDGSAAFDENCAGPDWLLPDCSHN